MRSPLQTRRQSLLPVLALLGVTSTALTLALTPRAEAIAGGLGGGSQPTSPRETTGAAPSVSLFQTSASSYTGGGGGGGGGESSSSPAEVTSRGASSGNQETGGEPRRTRATTSSEERGESAGRRRTARRREREEGGTAARSGRRHEEATARDGKENVSAKDKTVLTPPPKDRIVFTLGGGLESRYIYHGLDIISFNSQPDGLHKASSAIWFDNASLEYKGFRLGVNYVQAFDSTVPFYQGDPEISDVKGARLFKRRIYREVDVGLSYTVDVARLFNVTAGYNFYLFPNDDFKGTHFQGEALIKLEYKQLKYVRPSFTYFHYNSPFDDSKRGNLNGNFVEFRLDGTVPLLTRPNFSLSLEPYASGSYNIDYLKYATENVGGWNSFETGLKVPLRFGGHFTVTPFGNYGVSLTARDTNTINSFNQRTNSERTTFWGGLNVAYTF